MSALAESSWLAGIRGSDVRAFFAALGVDLGSNDGAEAAIRCFSNPSAHNHDDKTRSCSVNLGTGMWFCHGCGEKGNAYQAALAMGRREFDAMKLARDHGLAIEKERKSKDKPKLPNERQLKKWREALWEKPALIARLGELKCWSPWAIKRLGIGWNGERIVFPLRDQKLRRQGVALYLPSGTPKMLAVAGTTRQLFPAPEIIDRKVPLFIVEGEADAVSLWSMGFRATAVPGANGWRPEWAARLWKFKRIIVLCDCDRPGRQLAERLGAMPNTRVVDLEPGRSDGWDCGDLIREATAEGGSWQARKILEGITA